MKDNLLMKIKKKIDYLAVLGVFYILLYRIKVLKEIVKQVCQYLLEWFLHTDMVTLKNVYLIGEEIFKGIILIAVIFSVIMEIVCNVNEKKMESAIGENRFDQSLFKYLQAKSAPRVFLLTGKWGSGKTYEVNRFFNKYYKYSKTKVYRVSCFGLSSRKELIDEINNTIEQADVSIYMTTIKVLQYLPIIGKPLNKFLRKSYEYNTIKEGTIFIFDDFERITSRCIIVEGTQKLYHQSPFMLSDVHGGRNSNRELQDIKKEFQSIDKSFSQVDDYITQHSLREDYDKYIAVIGLINEIVETYGGKVIVVCNSDMLGEKFVHDVLRSKLNCIEYKKVITSYLRKAVVDDVLKRRIFDDEDKQKCLELYINLVKDNLETLVLDSKFNDLRIFSSLLEAFIDTAALFEKEELTTDFLNSLLNSMLVMHLAYYNNSIECVDSYVNGANIEFLISLFGGPIDISNLIHINHNFEETKWIDARISGYWILNLSKPDDLKSIYEQWGEYKYTELEGNMVNNHCFLDEVKDYSLLHILLYQKRHDKDEFWNLEREEYIKKSLQQFDLKNRQDVEYIFGIVYQGLRGRYYIPFLNAIFEIIAQEYGNGPLSTNLYLCYEYKEYFAKRNIT